MDLSGLIFVALAMAWAAYLIPKALRHHDDVVRGRSVDRFSQSMRVLARREPVSARMARLGRHPAGRDAGGTTAVRALDRRAVRRAPRRHPQGHAAPPPGARPAPARARRATVAACADRRLAWPYAAIPAGLLLAWLVACRLMVRKERAWRPAVLVEPPTSPVEGRRCGPAPGRSTPVVDGRRRPGGCGTPCRSPCRRTSRSRRPGARSAPSTSTRRASGPPAAPRPTPLWPARPRPPSGYAVGPPARPKPGGEAVGS